MMAMATWILLGTLFFVVLTSSANERTIGGKK